MSGQERNQMLSNTDWAHAWSSSSVWNGEGLMQIQVTNVGSQVSRRSVSDKSVHVGSIEINLTSVLVDQIVDFPDFHIVNASCRWECDHDTSEILAVGFNFRLKVFKVDFSVNDVDWNDFQSYQNSAGWIGTMGGGGDQADISMALTDALEIRFDGL